MDCSPEEFVKRLEAISESEGVTFGRVQLILEEEQRYSQTTLQYKGHFAISHAFQCFFMETVERINTNNKGKITTPVSEFYAMFVTRMAQSFQSLCGAERVATCGYPFLAYTLLRNTFDNLILTSAALQKITDFYSLEGVSNSQPSGQPFDPRSTKKLRKETEYEVRRKMTGSKSNLTPESLAAIDKWDMLFDMEVHGARLSLGQAEGWMRGTESLPVVPRFKEMPFGMYMNRCSEVSWMMHRLTPALQLPEFQFPEPWKDKWRVLDASFEQAVNSLTKQCGKPIGAAMVELVETKFPFNELSIFPL